MTNLYDRVKEEADKQGKTIRDVERAAGMSNGSLAAWKQSSPKVVSLVKVADALGISPAKLIGENRQA
jgi:transcriptional regulator with XRE-family HTH domain